MYITNPDACMVSISHQLNQKKASKQSRPTGGGGGQNPQLLIKLSMLTLIRYDKHLLISSASYILQCAFVRLKVHF